MSSGARARARSANNRQLHCIGSRCGGCGRQAARTAVRSEKTRCVDFHRRARKEKLKRPRIGSRGSGCGRQAARTAVRSEKTRCVDFHRRARKETLKRHSIGSIGNGCGRPAPRARRPCQSTGDTGYDPIQTGPSRRGGNLPVAERLAAAAAPFQGRCPETSDRSTSEKEASSRPEPASDGGGRAARKISVFCVCS